MYYNDFISAYTHLDGCVHKYVRIVFMKTQWAESSDRRILGNLFLQVFRTGFKFEIL